MKKDGIPASDVENTSGSGGVSAEGATAGVPRDAPRFAAELPAPALRGSPVPAAAPCERLCER